MSDRNGKLTPVGNFIEIPTPAGSHVVSIADVIDLSHMRESVNGIKKTYFLVRYGRHGLISTINVTEKTWKSLRDQFLRFVLRGQEWYEQ